VNPLPQYLLSPILDQRPLLLAIAGPNGAGKTTFYKSQILQSDLQFVNADVLSITMRLDPYLAAKYADYIRRDLVKQRKSFAFETVFSDPVGEKVNFLQDASDNGYTVALFFIGIQSPELSDERVAQRVMQGGQDVPRQKLIERFPRVLENLKAAISVLPHVFVLDNSDLRNPYRLLVRFEAGKPMVIEPPLPPWFLSVWNHTA